MGSLIRVGLALSVIGALPFLSVGLVMLVGGALGCELNEAQVLPCVVFGVDIGGVLTYLGVLGWLMLVSWPFLLVGGALLALAGLIALVRWARSG